MKTLAIITGSVGFFLALIAAGMGDAGADVDRTYISIYTAAIILMLITIFLLVRCKIEDSEYSE